VTPVAVGEGGRPVPVPTGAVPTGPPGDPDPPDPPVGNGGGITAVDEAGHSLRVMVTVTGGETGVVVSPDTGVVGTAGDEVGKTAVEELPTG